MKWITISVFFAMLFLGSLVASPAMATPSASLTLVNSPISVGDTFQVEVWADGDDSELALLAFGFDVSFENGDVFNYTGFTLGPGFDDDTLFVPMDVAGSTFPGILQDDVLLATLSFTTLAISTDTLNVTGDYDALFSGLYYELPDWDLTGYDISTSLTITAGTQPVPEPATILLFGAGLVSLASMKRKSMIN